jgi:hypothetical protein
MAHPIGNLAQSSHGLHRYYRLQHFPRGEGHFVSYAHVSLSPVTMHSPIRCNN